MQTITAQNLRGQLGNIIDELESNDSASVMIERNSKQVAMLLPAEVGREAILSAYALGRVSRGMAMRQLGYGWYGELLEGLARAGIERPTVASAEMESMEQTALEILPKLPKPRASKP